MNHGVDTSATEQYVDKNPIDVHLKDVLTRQIFDMQFLRYMAIDCYKIVHMINWICLTLTCKFSIKLNLWLIKKKDYENKKSQNS